MTSCPVCNKAVDPLRARHVRVVGVKVISYCSAECFQSSAPPGNDATSGAGAPKAVPSAVAAERKVEDPGARSSGPDAKGADPRKVEPKTADKGEGKVEGKGVAKSEAKNDGKSSAKGSDGKPAAADSKAAARQVEPAAKPEGKVEARPEAKSEPKPEPKAEAKSEGKVEAKPEPKPDPKPDPKAENKAEAKADPKAEAKAAGGTKPEGKADAKSAAKGENKNDSKGERKPDGKGENKNDSKGERKPDGKGERNQGDAKPDSKAEGKVAKSAEPKASPVPVAKPAATDSAASAAAADLSEASEAAPTARPWLKLVAVLVIAVVGGGVWWLTRPSAPPPPPPPAPVAPPVAEVPPPPPVIVPADAHARAVDVLRAHFTVESLRVRRVAAAALGRQADAQAITVLADLLPTEQSEIAKLDIAYGLARAKDPRGLELLLAGLGSSRRDVKGEAARLLASLRDARAMATLSSLSNLQQFRLSATEQLARLGNKQAMERLEKLRADPEASEEDRRRATIAIGDAGGAHVAEELRALLTDQRFNVKAAAALAVLRDESCRPLLLEHLTIPSLRVDAALALRRLEPTLDASTFLYRLMPALESAKDTERVEAAEAILLLTGPAGVAELD